VTGRGAWAAGEAPVWVLLSDQSPTYTEVGAALQAEWRPALRGRELVVLSARELPASPLPSALITLGSAATQLAMARAEASPEWARVPMLAGLLPRDGFNAIWKRPPAWVSAAWLDQPFERYLELIRRALPRLHRVGVLLGPATQGLRPALAKAAADRGLQLVVGSVNQADEMYPSLRAVLADAEVLLVLPDRTVGDPTALQNMLITAYRQRVPVVGYSPALVKSGATLGLYASPAQVGRQLAAMLKPPIAASNWPASRPAEGFTVVVNEQVSRSLGLDVPDVTELTEALRRQEGLR
jgi:putative ABC transport system substrate-binding protein